MDLQKLAAAVLHRPLETNPFIADALAAFPTPHMTPRQKLNAHMLELAADAVMLADVDIEQSDDGHYRYVFGPRDVSDWTTYADAVWAAFERLAEEEE